MPLSFLIIKPSSLGDILHGIPGLEMLRRQWPDAAIDWVVNDGLADILTAVPGIRRIIRFPRKSWRRIPGFLKELRREEYDAVIDYQGLLRSGLMCAMAHGKRKFGFANAREGAPFFYNKKITPSDNAVHAVDKNLFLTAEVIKSLGENPNANTISAQTASADESRGSHTIAVCFASRWPSKDWPLAFIADSLNLAAAQIPDLKIRLIGSSDDIEKAAVLKTLITSGHVEDLTGRTSLPELMDILKHCRAMLTVDSGPMHIAAAVHTPCIALFGSTDPAKTGPYGAIHSIVRSRCPNAPCFKRICPRNANCAKGISPQIAAIEIIRKLAD